MQSMTSIILLVYRPVAFHIQHRSYNLELVSRHVSEPQFECNCGANERRLLKDLLDKYNTLERPVANESEALEVKFGITLQQIIDVDEKNQILTTNAWLKLVSDCSTICCMHILNKIK
ncbi:hypothetical protein G9C98_003305 [Cotesia typhae]|uniref:Neurotransmitter-gated ion-channel ligand-binding domain-containing protein n=1 Tax=Cotesia typhae TaxID=2053667 RepID=A0A8J5QRC8_9HYME|nr:hypothetical protein G9C98_003305 [Cotesia typhae]